MVKTPSFWKYLNIEMDDDDDDDDEDEDDDDDDDDDDVLKKVVKLFFTSKTKAFRRYPLEDFALMISTGVPS